MVALVCPRKAQPLTNLIRGIRTWLFEDRLRSPAQVSDGHRLETCQDAVASSI